MEGFKGEGAGASRDPQAEKHGLLRQQGGVETGAPRAAGYGGVGERLEPLSEGLRGSFQGVQRAVPHFLPFKAKWQSGQESEPEGPGFIQRPSGFLIPARNVLLGRGAGEQPQTRREAQGQSVRSSVSSSARVFSESP